MALISQEVSGRARDRDPGPGPRRVPAVPAEPAATAPTGSRRRSIRRPTSTTSTRAAARPAATSRTPRSPQAFYNKEEGVTRLATETGAGQWGSALAFAGAVFGLEVKVYMVRASYDQKPYRRILMETYGAQVVASPSPDTNYGRTVLAETPGPARARSGMAISEAVEDAATRDDTKYSLGSVLNHVLLHQTVIGQEAIEQMEMAGEEPDVDHRLRRRRLELRRADVPVPRPQRSAAAPSYRVIAVEPEAAPRLTRGVYAYDFGDTGKMAPIVKMHTLGSRLHPRADPRRRPALPRHVAAGQPAQGARRRSRPGASTSARRFEAGVQFARAEGILPAPEPTHAIKVAIDEALAAKEAGEARVILFNLCGHGHFDLSAYERYLDGSLEDYEYPAEKVAGRAGRACRRSDRSPMPRLACWSCGRQIYTVAPLEALFAEERRCPRCGAYLRDERRETERRKVHPAPEPGRRPGTAGGRAGAAGRVTAARIDAAAAARHRPRRRATPAGRTDRAAVGPCGSPSLASA